MATIVRGWKHNDTTQQWEYREGSEVIETVADEALAQMPPDVLRQFWSTRILGPSRQGVS